MNLFKDNMKQLFAQPTAEICAGNCDDDCDKDCNKNCDEDCDAKDCDECSAEPQLDSKNWNAKFGKDGAKDARKRK